MDENLKREFLQFKGYNPDLYDIDETGTIINRAQPSTPNPTESPLEDVAQPTVPKSSGWKAAGASALESILPGLAGVGTGAALGSPLGPPGMILGGLIGALGGKLLQDEFIPEDLQEQLAILQSEHPLAYLAGGFAASPLTGMSGSLRQMGKAGLALPKATLGAKLMPEELQALGNVGLGSAISMGQNVGVPLAYQAMGEDVKLPSFWEIMGSGIGGAYFNTPNRIGRALGLPAMETPNLNALRNELRVPEPQAPPQAPIDPELVRIAQLFANRQPEPPIDPTGRARTLQDVSEGTVIQREGKEYSVPIKEAYDSAMNIAHAQQQAGFPFKVGLDDSGQLAIIGEEIPNPKAVPALPRAALSPSLEQTKPLSNWQVKNAQKQAKQAEAEYQGRVVEEDIAKQEKLKAEQKAAKQAELERQRTQQELEASLRGNTVARPQEIPKPMITTELGKEIYPDYTGVSEQNAAEVRAESAADLEARRLEGLGDKYSSGSELTPAEKHLLNVEKENSKTEKRRVYEKVFNKSRDAFLYSNRKIPSIEQINRLKQEILADKNLIKFPELKNKIEAAKNAEDWKKINLETEKYQDESIPTAFEEREVGKIRENQLPSEPTNKWFTKLAEWTKGVRGLNTKFEPIIGADGKPKLGAFRDRLIKINPELAAGDTQPHELTHAVLAELRASGRPQDKQLLKKLETVVGKSDEFKDWQKKSGGDLEEYLARTGGLEGFLRIANYEGDTYFKTWRKDMWSYVKTRFGKHASEDELRRLLSYESLYRKAPKGAGYEGAGIQYSNDSVLKQDELLPDQSKASWFARMRGAIDDTKQIKYAEQEEYKNNLAEASPKKPGDEEYSSGSILKTPSGKLRKDSDNRQSEMATELAVLLRRNGVLDKIIAPIRPDGYKYANVTEAVKDAFMYFNPEKDTIPFIRKLESMGVETLEAYKIVDVLAKGGKEFNVWMKAADADPDISGINVERNASGSVLAKANEPNFQRQMEAIIGGLEEDLISKNAAKEAFINLRSQVEMGPRATAFYDTALAQRYESANTWRTFNKLLLDEAGGRSEGKTVPNVKKIVEQEEEGSSNFADAFAKAEAKSGKKLPVETPVAPIKEEPIPAKQPKDKAPPKMPKNPTSDMAVKNETASKTTAPYKPDTSTVSEKFMQDLDQIRKNTGINWKRIETDTNEAELIDDLVNYHNTLISQRKGARNQAEIEAVNDKIAVARMQMEYLKSERKLTIPDDQLEDAFRYSAGSVLKSIGSKALSEVQKVRQTSPELADGLTKAYQLRRSFAGRFSKNLGEIVKTLGWNPKSRWMYSDENHKKALEYMYDIRDKGTSSIKLNADQQKIVDLAQEVFDDVTAEVGTRAGFPEQRAEIPDIPSREVTDIVFNRPDSTEGRKLHADWYAHYANLGVAKPEAQKLLANFKNSYYRRFKGQGEQYSALDNPDRMSLPRSWRENNLLDILNRYIGRSARRLAYYDAIENDPTVSNLLTDPDKTLKNARSVKNVLDDLQGVIEPEELGRQAFSGLVRSTMMGPLTGVKDFASTFTLGWQHMDMNQVPGAVINSIRDFRNNLAESFTTGVNRRNVAAIEMTDLSFEAGSQHARRLRDVINTIQGRNGLEKMARTIAYGQGKFLAMDAIAARGKLSKQQKAFLDNFGPKDWAKIKNFTPEQIKEMAAQYTESVQGTYDYRGLPEFSQRGTLAPVLSLARWNIEKMNNFYEYVIKPAQAGNFKPLLMQTVGMLLGGSAVNYMQEQLTGKREKTPKVKEMLAGAKAGHNQFGPVAYKLAALASMSGYMGWATDILRTGLDFKYKNRSQGYENPFLIGIKNLVDNARDIAEAIDAGEEDFLVDALTNLLEDFSQAARLILPLLSEDRAEAVERSNRYRDLKAWKITHDKELGSYSENTANPLLNRDVKKFKRTSDLEEAMSLRGTLIKKAFEKGGKDPEKIYKELDKLRRNSYQTMPSPWENERDFIEYYSFLKRTKSPEEVKAIVVDYFKQNALNEAKSDLIP